MSGSDITPFLTHLTYRDNAKQKRVISNNIVTVLRACGKHALADVNCYCEMTSIVALDGVMSLLRLKDVTYLCKHMRHSPTIGRISSVQWRKLRRSWRLQVCFCRLLCVRIEIYQLKFVNGWVIIHCLLVSCTKVNHLCCVLVIWSSLQLTSKQWIIIQQFTARADIFLKYQNW